MTPGVFVSAAPGSPRRDASALPLDLLGGNPKQCGYVIDSLQIQNGKVIPLAQPGVTAIVGGNNAGKSTLLRQIRDTSAISPGLPENPGPPHLLTAMTELKRGTAADVAAWLLEYEDLVSDGGIGQPTFRRYGADSLNPAFVSHFWGGTHLGDLSSHLVHYADARTRHTWTAGAPRRENFTDPATHPIHVFEFDQERLDEISKIARRAFSNPLTIDRLSGLVQFRVGTPTSDPPPIDRPTVEYQTELAALPLLANQGDGMVFMLGALIPIVAGTFPVVLLDEPEAFLHPPQAYLMGQALAELAAKRQLQLIVATHDRNILRGLISEPATDVNILRLSRDGNNTAAQLLSVEKVRAISNDNVLRHTNILDGLFHRLVVLAENERDCRFYQAALEHLDARETLAIRPHDVLFVPTNGKGNMAHVADILKGTGVRIVASPDLDVLNNRTVISRLLTALGGEWNPNLDTLYTRATQDFQAPPTKLLNKDVRNTVDSILDEDPEAVFEGGRAGRIKDALKTPNRWDALKQRGKPAMNADKPAREELLKRLDAAGLVTVTVGELENFDPDASRSSKDAWLQEALTHGAHTTESAASHIRRLLEAAPPASSGSADADVPEHAES